LTEASHNIAIRPLIADALKLASAIIVDKCFDLIFPRVHGTLKAVLLEILKGGLAAAVVVVFTGLLVGRAVVSVKWRRRRIDEEGPEYQFSFEPETRSNYVRFNCQTTSRTVWSALVNRWHLLDGLTLTIDYDPAFLTLRDETTSQGANLFGTQQTFYLSSAEEFMEVDFLLERPRPYDTTTVTVRYRLTVNGQRPWYLRFLVRLRYPVRRIKIGGTDR
jgi:hypothetical protein